MIVVDLDEGAAGGDAGELFEEEAAFAASAEAEFADELFVAGALSGGALDASDQFAIGVLVRMAGHSPRIARVASALALRARLVRRAAVGGLLERGRGRRRAGSRS